MQGEDRNNSKAKLFLEILLADLKMFPTDCVLQLTLFERLYTN